MNRSRLLIVALLLPLACLPLVCTDAAAGVPRAGTPGPAGSSAGSSTGSAGPSAGSAGGAPDAAAPADPDPAGTWVWPLPPPHPVLRAFQAPATLYAPGHRGLDLAAAQGRDVVSPADGVVSFAGVVVDRPVLSIEHADGLVSSFEPVAAGVAVGDQVTAGQLVGQVADGGHCAGTCLHFGARLNGGYVSPLRYLVGVPRAVLLPAL